MCRVPAGPPPAALYESPTWLEDGCVDGDSRDDDAPLLQPGTGLLAAPSAPLPDVDAALLDSLLLGGVKAEAPAAAPVVKAEPSAVVAQRAFVPAPSPAGFLAGMFEGLPVPYPTGPVTHLAAAELAAVAVAKRSSSPPPENVERVKKRRRESAQRSRARKSAFVHALEVENAALRAAVSRLEASLAALTGQRGGESAVTAAAAAAAAIARQAPPIVTPGGTGVSTFHALAAARADSSAASGASTPGAARAAAAAAAAVSFGGMVPV